MQALPAAKHSQYYFWHLDFIHLHLIKHLSTYFYLVIFYSMGNGRIGELCLALSSGSYSLSFGVLNSCLGDGELKVSSALSNFNAKQMNELQFSVINNIDFS